MNKLFTVWKIVYEESQFGPWIKGGFVFLGGVTAIIIATFLFYVLGLLLSYSFVDLHWLGCNASYFYNWNCSSLGFIFTLALGILSLFVYIIIRIVMCCRKEIGDIKEKIRLIKENDVI